MDAEEVNLGFLSEARPEDLRRWMFPSKVGGRPAWPECRVLPLLEDISCANCQQPLTFLLQVYAPADEAETGNCRNAASTFHRTLLLFGCMRCSSEYVVLRCQMPKENSLFPSYPLKAVSSSVFFAEWRKARSTALIGTGCTLQRPTAATTAAGENNREGAATVRKSAACSRFGEHDPIDAGAKGEAVEVPTTTTITARASLATQTAEGAPSSALDEVAVETRRRTAAFARDNNNNSNSNNAVEKKDGSKREEKREVACEQATLEVAREQQGGARCPATVTSGNLPSTCSSTPVDGSARRTSSVLPDYLLTRASSSKPYGNKLIADLQWLQQQERQLHESCCPVCGLPGASKVRQTAQSERETDKVAGSTTAIEAAAGISKDSTAAAGCVTAAEGAASKAFCETASKSAAAPQEPTAGASSAARTPFKAFEAAQAATTSGERHCPVSAEEDITTLEQQLLELLREEQQEQRRRALHCELSSGTKGNQSDLSKKVVDLDEEEFFEDDLKERVLCGVKCLHHRCRIFVQHRPAALCCALPEFELCVEEEEISDDGEQQQPHCDNDETGNDLVALTAEKLATSEMFAHENTLLRIYEEQEKTSPDSLLDASEQKAFEEIHKERSTLDNQLLFFLSRCNRHAVNRGHVLRYALGGRPLWPFSSHQLNEPPPPCASCGAPRQFEFQVLPQLLFALRSISGKYSSSSGNNGLSFEGTSLRVKAAAAVADRMHFALLSVYTCSAHCCGRQGQQHHEIALQEIETKDGGQRAEGAGIHASNRVGDVYLYIKEYVYCQPDPFYFDEYSKSKKDLIPVVKASECG